MHLNLKAKGQFDMSNWLLPCIALLQYKNSLKICARLFHSLMLKRTTAQFVIWQAINTIHWWEIWWEVDRCLESSKKWQNPQLFLLQATYWKLQTSQSSLRLSDLRTVPKFSKKPWFSDIVPVLMKDWVNLFVMILLVLHRHWRKCD